MVLTLLSGAGCQQVLGLDDYDVVHAGGSSASGGTPSGGSGGTAGSGQAGSTPNTGGTGGSSQGGSAGDSGGFAGNGGGTAGESGGAGSAGIGGSAGDGGTGGTSGSSGAAGSAGSGGSNGCHELELLQNANFDAGFGSWTQYSLQGQDVIFLETSERPAHTAPNLAWFGDWDPATPPPMSVTEESEIWQDVTIPPGATGVTVSGFRKIVTEEGPGVYDDVYVELWDDIGLVTEFGYWSNQNVAPNWVSFSSNYPDPSLAGQTLTFSINSWHDSSIRTVFFFDTLSLKATCP